MTGKKIPDMESSENDTDLSVDHIGTAEEVPNETILSRQTSVNLVPVIGQRFVSQDAAYEFYCSFAKQCGFSIRRHRTRGKDGVGRGVTRRDFACHRGGYPQVKQTDERKLQRNRKSSRCGCQAYLRIVKRADFDVPEWCVTGFSNNHNHELLKADEICVLPVHCTLSTDDKSRICMFAKAGMSVQQMLRLMELEKGAKLGCLPFTEKNVGNLLESFKHVDVVDDAIDLIGMCKKLKDENHNFQYDFLLGKYNRVDHIAWSYASSIQQYEAYGDVVVFDTTHRLDTYDMLLGLWVGVDNHGRACRFVFVLMRDENVQSFAWALKMFLSFMRGKAPQSILTDQNMLLKEAIACEMPNSKHAFCIWHIIAKSSIWFSVLLGSHYDSWKTEFYQAYNLEMVEDFEEAWRKMVDRYGLQSSKHMASLYALRTFWALPFLRRYFFGVLTNKSLPESINFFIQRILSAPSQPHRFIEKVADIAVYNDQSGTKLKIQQKLNSVCLKTGSPMESHAAAVLTPYAFSLLQEELVLAPQCASATVDEGCFQVRHHTQIDGGCKVTWDPHQVLIRCSCYKFEFLGILCRHVLRVLSINNCFHIPDRYLPIRWRLSDSCSMKPSATAPREHVKKSHLLESLVSAMLTASVQTKEQLAIACEQISMFLSHIKQLPGSEDDIAYNSPSGSLILPEVEDSDGGFQSFPIENLGNSVSLGKLKERRPPPSNGVDFSKKRRHCSIPCSGPFGHNACPIIGADHLNGDGDALGFLPSI